MADVEEALDGNVVVSSFILGDDDRTMWVPCLRQMVRAQSAPSQMKRQGPPLVLAALASRTGIRLPAVRVALNFRDCYARHQRRQSCNRCRSRCHCRG